MVTSELFTVSTRAGCWDTDGDKFYRTIPSVLFCTVLVVPRAE